MISGRVKWSIGYYSRQTLEISTGRGRLHGFHVVWFGLLCSFLFHLALRERVEIMAWRGLAWYSLHSPPAPLSLHFLLFVGLLRSYDTYYFPTTTASIPLIFFSFQSPPSQPLSLKLWTGSFPGWWNGKMGWMCFCWLVGWIDYSVKVLAFLVSFPFLPVYPNSTCNCNGIAQVGFLRCEMRFPRIDET